MMSRPFRLIAVVLALAAIAVVVISHRNHHYRNSVVGGPVEILVATKVIPKGTPGNLIRTTAGYLKLETMPQGEISTDAIVDPASLSGKVALKRIPAGEQLTSADFGPLSVP